MNNSILRTKHNASPKTIAIIQRLLKYNQLDYNIKQQNIHINECTGIRTYTKKQNVKEYDEQEVITALEEYVETLEASTNIVSRNVRKDAIEALRFMQNI